MNDAQIITREPLGKVEAVFLAKTMEKEIYEHESGMGSFIFKYSASSHVVMWKDAGKKASYSLLPIRFKIGYFL